MLYVAGPTILFGMFVFILYYLSKKKICQLGFHDKEKAGIGMNCIMYIKVCLDIEKPRVVDEAIATRDFFIDIDAQRIYTNIYSQFRTARSNMDTNSVNNYVCIKCGKCYDNTSYEKIMIEETVKAYLEKAKNKELRKQMAKDLYKENCGKR